jgi:ABC-type Fe2+-enterobactin transport system substrate-binding protein
MTRVVSMIMSACAKGSKTNKVVADTTALAQWVKAEKERGVKRRYIMFFSVVEKRGLPPPRRTGAAVNGR